MTRDLAELDRGVEVARLVDRIERDCRAGVAAEHTRGLLHTLALLAVSALTAALTWAARRASR